MKNKPFVRSFVDSTRSEASVYISPPEVVKINEKDGTMIVRWFPTEKQKFPSGLRMSIYASMRFFGSSNYTMDMTPGRTLLPDGRLMKLFLQTDFWVKPNFTVIALPSANLNISLHSWDFPSPPLCHGNITRDEPSRSNHEVENDSRRGRFSRTNLFTRKKISRP